MEKHSDKKIKTVKFQKPSQPKNPGQVPFLPGGWVEVSLIRSTSSRGSGLHQFVQHGPGAQYLKIK